MHMMNSIKKLLVFVGVNFGVGLFQSWALLLMRKGTTKAADPAVFFSDGGLFFFSTSLAALSFYALVSAPGSKFFKIESNDFFLTFFLCGFTVFVALVGYTFAIAQKTPFDPDLQLACLACSSVYAFYVATVTDMFKGKP